MAKKHAKSNTKYMASCETSDVNMPDGSHYTPIAQYCVLLQETIDIECVKI
jgi:hypothetical protein